MFALRRFANSVRSQSYHARVSQICSARQEASIHGSDVQEQNHLFAGNSFLPKMLSAGQFSFPLKHILCYKTQAGASTSGDESCWKGGFFELKEPRVIDDLLSEHELEDGFCEIQMHCEMDKYFEDVSAGTDVEKCGSFHELIVHLDHNMGMDTPHVRTVLDNYVKEGNSIGREEIAAVMFNVMRKWYNFALALQLSEWSEENKLIEMTDRDYGDRVYAITRLKGLHKAADYLERIPEQFKTEFIYRSLLESCVYKCQVKKAEEVFSKMRSLGFQQTTFVCNLLLLLYKRSDRKKIANILLMMEKENIKPTAFTYRILTSSSDRYVMGRDVRASVARYYIYGNLPEKGVSVMKEIEGDDIVKNRPACVLLLPLYAELGKVEEVERIWKVCEANPHPCESMAAIGAWHRLGLEDKKTEARMLYNGWFERYKGNNLQEESHHD